MENFGERVCRPRGDTAFPVDLKAQDDATLTSSSQRYLTGLESTATDEAWFEPSNMSKVKICADNMRSIDLFEDDGHDCSLLTLHSPDDPATVVALFLCDRWWSVDDVLRTSSKDRCGLVSVQSMVERVIVFLLSRVIEQRRQEEAPFSLHPRTEKCKLLWRDDEAVGFYSVKHKGSLCDDWSGRCYLLPVLDTVLVRRSCRRRGFGLQMLEDFCSAFSAEPFVGISSPLSPAMASVCRKFLQQNAEQRERLYEVEAPGDWNQRRNVWLNLQLRRYDLNTEQTSQSGERL